MRQTSPRTVIIAFISFVAALVVGWLGGAAVHDAVGGGYEVGVGVVDAGAESPAPSASPSPEATIEPPSMSPSASPEPTESPTPLPSATPTPTEFLFTPLPTFEPNEVDEG